MILFIHKEEQDTKGLSPASSCLQSEIVDDMIVLQPPENSVLQRQIVRRYL